MLYSRDGGTSWVPLAADILTSTLTVDSGYLAGGDLCRVKVRASDGFATAEDVSDAAFTVPRKPPEVTIQAPAEGAWYRAVEYINLIGQGYDPEDGVIPDGALEWWLNTETGGTMLGTGPMISVGPWAEGDYAISLGAMDSDGQFGGTFVTIHVGEKPGNTLYLPVVVKRG